MNLQDIKAVPVPRKKRKRVGRGEGSNWGKTCGKGQKGQKSRSGGKIRIAGEGGQMPLFRRIPKRGFTNIFRKEFAILNVRDLDSFKDGDTVNITILHERGLIKKGIALLKVLGEGEVTKKVNVVADKFSGTARTKIEAAGGTIEEAK